MLKEKELKAEKVLLRKTIPRYTSTKKERKPRKIKIPRGTFLSALDQSQWLHTEVRGGQGSLSGLVGKVSSVLMNGQVIITSATDGAEIQCDPDHLIIMYSNDFDDDYTSQSADDYESIDEGVQTTSFGKRRRQIDTIIHRKRNDLQEKYRKVIPASASDMDLVQNIMKTIMSPEFEKEAVHSFISTCCQTCLAEKWDGAKFCWNENCYSSPIYWKTTGVKSASSSVAKAVKPLNIINISNTVKTSNDENMSVDNIINISDMLSDLERIASTQSPIATIPSVPIEAYRPSSSDTLYCSSFNDLRENACKARSDSNVTDVESFSPLEQKEYYSEDEIEPKKQFLVDDNVSRMIM